MNSDANSSNVARLPNKEVVKEEAGAWLVRIDQGQLTREDITEFQQWVGQSAFHRDYLEKLARNWDSMSVLEELADLFPIASHEHLIGQSRPKEARHVWLRPSVWAAGLAACCVLVVTLFWQNELPQTEYITEIGQQASWRLADGSDLTLNTNSQAEVDFSGELRVVRLLQGEASFDVAKNPSRPFVVYAGSGMVWAVGTAFNVRYGDKGVVDVTVTEGTVKVYADTQVEKLLPDSVDEPMREVIATAGQFVQYKEVIKPTLPTVNTDLEKKLAWQQGALVFDGETLEEVLLEVARYTDKQLVISDPDIKAMQIGGYYKTDDIDALLDTLSRGFDLDVQKMADNRIHLSNKN